MSLSMNNPELELVRTMNENLFDKLVRNDNEKSKMLEFIEKLVFDKKESTLRDTTAKNNIYQQQAELDQIIEAFNEEKEEYCICCVKFLTLFCRIIAEKQKIDEEKEALRREKEALTKKKESLREVVKSIKEQEY